MPNLVGIGNSQVPTNAMLGGLAYQDSVGEIDIEKIKAKTGTSGTAKDIFVYDTRKDSDGGAWRKRATTQSWYNEGVSKTRGARKEFPAVAVIVVQASQVTIYDGDDPNFSLWMRFTQSTTQLGAMVGYTGATITCCTMLNGVLMVGLDHSATQGNVSGLRIINFISERFDWKANIAGRNSNQHWPIIDRNGGRPFGVNDGFLITDEYIIDVTATVLPDTPIDESMGIPNPTIAIATKQSLSIIQHDRRVINKKVTDTDVDITSIDFTSDGNIVGTRNHYNYVYITKITPTSDVSFPSQYPSNINYFRADGTHFPPPHSPVGHSSITGYGNANQVVSIKGGPGDFASADTYGLSIFNVDTSPSTVHSDHSLVSYITKDFNTGYLIGDIRGSYLSSIDTTTASIANRNLITNSTFANTNNWTGASNGVLSITNPGLGSYAGGSVLRITNTGGSNGRARSNSFSTTVGKTYGIKVSFTNRSSGGQYRVEVRQVDYDLVPMSGTTTAGVYEFDFTSAGNGTYILELYCLGNDGEWAEFDDVYVYELEQDHSDKKKGLGIRGSITKTPVATGAELIAYSGFSNSNYFRQIYNSNLDFGTGDLCIMFWAKFSQNDAYDDLIHRRAHDGSNYTGTGWYLQMGNDQNITLKDSATGQSRAIVDADSTYGYWQHFCFIRRNKVGYAYKNGKPQSTNGDYAWTENLNNSSAILTIGRSTASGGGDADRTSLALVRFSATAPSEEEIKKMYEEEKCLFHENAKCTLYGTSDDIKGLAYDDFNDVIHVGTSSGRSEFQGLNRINNTTTAVTSAISVSDGLVVEQ